MSAAESIEKAVPPLVYRPPTNEELRLIKASWLHPVDASRVAMDEYGERWVKVGVPKKTALQIEPSIWLKAHAALRDKIMSDMRTILVVACLASKPEEAIAWACVEKCYDPGAHTWRVWWIHVVGEARGTGIGTALVAQLREKADGDDAVLVAAQMAPRAREWWGRVTA